MAVQYVCDRCKRQCGPGTNLVHSPGTINFPSIKQTNYDLCSRCKSKLVRFLKGEEDLEDEDLQDDNP